MGTHGCCLWPYMWLKDGCRAHIEATWVVKGGRWHPWVGPEHPWVGIGTHGWGLAPILGAMGTHEWGLESWGGVMGPMGAPCGHTRGS